MLNNLIVILYELNNYLSFLLSIIPIPYLYTSYQMDHLTQILFSELIT
jgi:hypothetical protein